MEQNIIFLDSFCREFFTQSSVESMNNYNRLKFSSRHKDLRVSLEKFLEGDFTTTFSISRMDPFLKNDLGVLLDYIVEHKNYSSENPNTLLSIFESLEKFQAEESKSSVIEIINPFKTFETSFNKFFDTSTTLRVSRYV